MSAQQTSIVRVIRTGSWCVLLVVILVGLVASSGLLPDKLWSEMPGWLRILLFSCGGVAALAVIGNFIGDMMRRHSDDSVSHQTEEDHG